MRPAPAKSFLILALLAAAFSLASESARALGQASDAVDLFAERAECVSSLEKSPPKAALGAPLPDVSRSCSILKAATDPRLKEPFAVRPHDGRGPALPARADKYANTVYRLAKNPERVPEGASVVRGVEIGYNVSSDFKFVAPLNYAVLARDGSVLEVGATSREAIDELKAHLFGRSRTPEELSAIARMSRELIDALRAIPRLRTKLEAFAKQRGWERGLEDRALLVYVDSDPSLEPFIRKWASDRGYTLGQLREAGWMRLSYSYDGSARWSLARKEAVVIPFLAADGYGVSSWRIRNTGTSNPNLPKYLSFPKDRAADDPEPGLPDQLYNLGALAGARGKTVVITEGEFKALVAQDASGVTTVGILGITNWDDDVIQALVNAGASEYVVILDRDPGGSGLMRADGVSDSQRAAYAIAHALEQAGGRAKVGVLPDAFSGKKVGIDDLIMAKPGTGVDGLALYRKTIAEALSPEGYARSLGIDPEFFELARRRREISKRLRDYEQSERRGGAQVPAVEYRRAKDALAQLNRDYQSYLKTHLNGATRLDQPVATRSSIDRIQAIPDAGSKRVLADGKALPLDLFTGDLLILEEESPSLLRDFPSDDYAHERNVVFFTRDSRGAWSESLQVPGIVRKKSSGRAVAFVLPKAKGNTGFGLLRAFLRASLPADPIAPRPVAKGPQPRAPPELGLGVARVLGDEGAHRFFSGWEVEDLKSYRELIDQFRLHLIEHLRDRDRGERIPRDYALAVTGSLGELLASAEFRSRLAPGIQFVPDEGKGRSLVNDRNRPDGVAYRMAPNDEIVVTGLLESKIGKSNLFEPQQYRKMLGQWKTVGAWIAGRLRQPSQIFVEVAGVVKPITTITDEEFLRIVSVYQPNGSQTIEGVHAVLSVPVDPAKLRLVGLSVVSAALSPYFPDVFPRFQKDFEELVRLYRNLGNQAIRPDSRIAEILRQYDFQLFDDMTDARDPALGSRIRRDRAQLGIKRDVFPPKVGTRSREEFDAWKAGRLSMTNPLELAQLRLRYEPQPLFEEFLAREKRWPVRHDLTKVTVADAASAIIEERFAATIEETGGELAYFLTLSNEGARSFLKMSSWRPSEQDMRALLARPDVAGAKRGFYLDRLRAMFGFKAA